MSNSFLNFLFSSCSRCFWSTTLPLSHQDMLLWLFSLCSSQKCWKQSISSGQHRGNVDYTSLQCMSTLLIEESLSQIKNQKTWVFETWGKWQRKKKKIFLSASRCLWDDTWQGFPCYKPICFIFREGPFNFLSIDCLSAYVFIVVRCVSLFRLL